MFLYKTYEYVLRKQLADVQDLGNAAGGYDREIINASPIPSIAIRADYQPSHHLLAMGFEKIGHWSRSDYKRRLEVWVRRAVPCTKEQEETWYNDTTPTTDIKEFYTGEFCSCCGAYAVYSGKTDLYVQDGYGHQTLNECLEGGYKAGFFVEKKGEDYREVLTKHNCINILTTNEFRLWFKPPRSSTVIRRFIKTNKPIKEIDKEGE